MTSDTSSPTATWSLDGGALRRAGEPVLLLGGQVHNSSSSSPGAIARSFAHVRRMNGNTVLAPVSWALLEPTEGTFDFTLVDAMLDEAGSNGLRLVPLWFGAFKNATSTYAPRWVRQDPDRFPRARLDGTGPAAFTYAGAMPTPVLSVFGRALRDSDARAFEALLTHLAEADVDDVVALVQVENEVGVLRDSRDRSEPAEKARGGQVPDAILRALAQPGPDTMMRTLWAEQGSAPSGTWEQLFGGDTRADEVFMAWGFASYVGELAERGAAIADIPMYANAWLGPQPGQENPGQWPSGGPASRVLDVWRAAAPSLGFVSPDIYVDDADWAMRIYASVEQPLFVPECRLSAAELIRAVGTYLAIGWSAFGIDGASPDGQAAATLDWLTSLEGPVARAQSAGRIAAVVLEPGAPLAEVVVGDVRIATRGLLDLLHRMLLDAGVQAPAAELALPDETLPGEPVPVPGETRPFGLLFADEEDEDAIIVVGQNLKLDFFAEGFRVEIDSVEELRLEGGGVVGGKVINGDERLTVVPVDRVGAARIRLLRLPVD